MHPRRPPSLRCHRRKVLPDLSREATCYLPRSHRQQLPATRHHVASSQNAHRRRQCSMQTSHRTCRRPVHTARQPFRCCFLISLPPDSVANDRSIPKRQHRHQKCPAPPADTQTSHDCLAMHNGLYSLHRPSCPDLRPKHRPTPVGFYLGHTPRLQDFKHPGYQPGHRGPTRPLKPFLR